MSVVTSATLVTINGKLMYEFLGSGTIKFPRNVSTSVLIVGGGGGGGGGAKDFEGGGGGGGGGVGVGTLLFAANETYTITVGQGGAGGPATATSFSSFATSGTDTSIIGTGINEVAYGGGYGNISNRAATRTPGSGGSGGGGSGINLNGTATRGSGTLTYYGNDGAPAVGFNYPSGGGGGAGGVTTGEKGGDGYLWSVTNLAYGAGGGAGSRGAVINLGGTGGGGTGGYTNVVATSGAYGRGAGGGGAWGGVGGGSTGGYGSVGVVYILAVYVGTVPTINSLTYGSTSFSLSFTPSTGAYPDVTTYYYSLNGITYVNANTATSPINIYGVTPGVSYPITIIANNSAGNTAPSNVFIGFIPYPCFLEGSKILRLNPETDNEEYIAVEKLRRGDLIRTAEHGYKAIELIGHTTIPNPMEASKESRRLYWFRKSKCANAGLFEDLCVTGDHCILHRTISDEKRKQIAEYMRDIYVTENHYRVPAFLDDRAEPYTRDGPATIWHFALENPNIYHNYGVMANGLLVESCSLHYMYKHSNMRMI